MTHDELLERRTVQLKLPQDLIAQLDGLKAEYGLRSRGAIVERLLLDLLNPDSHGELQDPAEETGDHHEGEASAFDECRALVLVAHEGGPEQSQSLALRPESGTGEEQSGTGRASVPRSRGIDLPGFVRRQSEQVRRSLHPPRRGADEPLDPLPPVSLELLEQGLERVRSHWLELYAKEADEAVLEAAMVWLAQDIWPQSDQSEGRPFSWSLVCGGLTNLVPSWAVGSPTFEKVVVAAGILEDPYSASTLVVRIPTLIRRFVHRYRRRRGTPFQTLEHTMTLHGALKLLQLPTTPGQRLTLPQIREAFRQMALAHHPDAGGSEEAMRRLNEAYQLLKELYRQPRP